MRLKRISQTLLTQYKTLEQGPGLGDFLRGAIAIAEYAIECGADFSLDLAQHPIGCFLCDTAPYVRRDTDEVYEYFNHHPASLWEHLERAVGDFCVATNAFPRGVRADDATRLVAKRFRPQPELHDRVDQFAHGINDGRFVTMHLRSGDPELFAQLSLEPSGDAYQRVHKACKRLENDVLPALGLVPDEVLVVSDNILLIDMLRNSSSGIHVLPGTPRHLSAIRDAESARVLLESFFVMAQARHIFQYTVYEWGSGFSDMCARLYDVPLTRRSTNELL